MLSISMLLGEPTCTVCVVQFEVVAVATQPCFHHIQKLPSDEVVQFYISAKWLELVEVCVSPSTSTCFKSPLRKIEQNRKKGRKTGVSSQVETTSHAVCKDQDLGKSTFNRKCAFFTFVMKVSLKCRQTQIQIQIGIQTQIRIVSKLAESQNIENSF